MCDSHSLLSYFQFPLVDIYSACKQFGLDEKLLANNFNSLKSSQLQKRSSIPAEIYCFGSNFEAPDRMYIKKYDTKTEMWKSGAFLDGIWDSHRECVFVNGRLIILGGSPHQNAAPQLDVLCVDIRTGELNSLQEMPAYRKSMSVVHCNNEIYTIGGQNRTTTLRTAAK